MSESVVADFVGSFNSEVSGRAEPVRGRILLSEVGWCSRPTKGR
ncbi:MAG: hypothetical protein V5A44_11960 [Haloarculaceae archaeon]